MIVRNKLTLIAAAALTIASSVHAATPDAADAYFVGDSLLTAAPRSFDLHSYTRDPQDLGAYSKLYIEEIQFQYAADSVENGMNQSQKARITQSARESLLQGLGGRFKIVDSPGPGVLRLRTAIIDIRLEHKRRNLLSFTPVGLVKQGVEAATGHDMVLRGATVEADLLDSVSGERLMSMIDPRAAFADNDGAGKASWKEVNRTFDRLAQTLAAQPAI